MVLESEGKVRGEILNFKTTNYLMPGQKRKYFLRSIEHVTREAGRQLGKEFQRLLEKHLKEGVVHCQI